MSKPPIAILTLHPNNIGGILSATRVVYNFCEQYFEPKLFFLGFDKEISAHLRPMKWDSSIREAEYFGMKSVEIGARWAFWEPRHYTNTLNRWGRALKGYKYFFVVGGNPIPAHPLVKLNKKFVVWAATTSQAEREYRYSRGQSFFRKIIDSTASVFMNRIELEIIKNSDCILSQSSYFNLLCNDVLGYERNIKLCGYPKEPNIHMDRDLILKPNKNIIAVGRFDDDRKNVGMLLRAFDKIYTKVRDVKLYVIGLRPADEKISAFKNLASFGNVIFTGKISAKDLDDHYKKASLMLITSHQEGLGIIGLEAFSYGIPVIATDCGGVRDYVFDGKTGYLVDINDDYSMSEKAIEVLNCDITLRKMSSNALNLVNNNYSHSNVYSVFREGLSDVYPELKKLF